MIARDVMTAPVYIVSPRDTVAYARNLMVKHRISRILIMDNGKLTGLLTKKDIAYRIREQEPAWRRRPIDHIPVDMVATKDPFTVDVKAGTGTIAKVFAEKDISCLPVTESGTVVGIVTKTDLMKSAMFGSLKMPVSELMVDAVTISRYHSIDHVIEQMNDLNDKLVVVNNDGTLAGVISETNLAFFEPYTRRPGSEERDVTFLRKDEPAGTKQNRYVFKASVIAEDVMSHPVVTIGPGARVAEAVASMREHRVNSLVVVEHNEIKGIIKRDDIIREVAK